MLVVAAVGIGIAYGIYKLSSAAEECQAGNLLTQLAPRFLHATLPAPNPTAAEAAREARLNLGKAANRGSIWYTLSD